MKLIEFLLGGYDGCRLIGFSLFMLIVTACISVVIVVATESYTSIQESQQAICTPQQQEDNN